MSTTNAESTWLRRAQATARRCNWAWFLDRLALPLVLLGLLATAFILVIRREGSSLPLLPVLCGSGGAFVLALLIAWWQARRRFTTLPQALVRLETAMALDNALTAARAGVTPWPAPGETSSDGTRWNWPRLLLPPLAILLLLSAACLLPISAKSQHSPPPEEPGNRQALQASLDELREEKLVDEDYLDDLEEKINKLREQPEENWFDHAALEATDTLKETHEKNLRELEKSLQKAERSLQALQNNAAELTPGNRERLMGEFAEALEKMNRGAMKPNQELREQLGKIDPSQLGQLSPEQLNQLRQNMREHAQKMQQSAPGQPGGGEGPGGEWLDELLQEGGTGNQPGQAGQQPGSQPGQGGINRGPGTAPGVLGQKGDPLAGGGLEGLQSRDLSQTLPGDLLQLEDGEHQVDKVAPGVRGGGQVDNLGQGGDLIWKIAPNLHPAEKQALREFFK
ncbi:hypothetical protein [Roseibacillus ishigakijimensis]|uniref:Uncharacterized protein n=1 Tax=Roseibacillus ishigakijimensis TaxID=454146 RepID=A0A934RPY1_9BACT|nr:hypothetical protein [Roseibacillus ishigakijimensis]MBK1835334.1 hypothetical protein [Roseibacillus ishigakijimensis]